MLRNQSYYFENSSATDNETTFERIAEASFIYSAVFILFIPYIVFLTLCYLSRKTDNRQPQFALQFNVIGCSFLCIIGTFFLSILSLMIQSSKTLVTESSDSLHHVIHVFFANCLLRSIVSCPQFILIIFYYFILLIAFQRVVLIAKAKVGMQLLTGRRLRCKIILLYFVAITCSFSKLMNTKNCPWLEVVLLGCSAVLFLVACLLLRHIERKLVASAHITVIVQTVPLFLILTVFTAAELMLSYMEEPTIEIKTLRTVSSFTVSFFTPICIILGSWAKRRIVWAVLTCKWDEQHGRGELYTAERSPVERSNAVSLSPSPTIRF